MKRMTWIVGTLSLTLLACGPTDLARELLGRLPTVTPTPTPATELHDSVTWYVATDGDDANSCAVPTAACLTVQAAIEKAGDDDVIEIAPGTYLERAPRIAAGILIEDRTISVRGAGSDATFLEPMFAGHTVFVIRDADVGISRLTIQGGREGTSFGIRASATDLRLSDIVIQDNEDIGVMLTDARSTFRFSNLIIQRNVGGMALEGEGTIDNSHILANHDTGILNGAILTVSNSTIEGNRANNGPGIRNNTGAQLTLEGSTLARNTAIATTHSIALGIRNDGIMMILNSTISNNEPVEGGSGAAITSQGDLTLIHSTVAANDGTGVISFGGSVTFDNALLGDNARQDCSITSSTNHFLGVTLDSDESCTRWHSSDRSTHSLFMGPLADNGGPTETHALLSSSQALDAASGDCPIEDQRGVSRPAGSGCDVGAFEFDPLTSATPISGEATPPPPPMTVTPVPSPSTVVTDTLCWKGPGSLYEVVSSVGAGTEVTLLGRGLDGNWWIIDNPRYPGVACWIPEATLDVDPSLDISSLPFIKAPPPPTPTATPITGCLYQGPNDPQPVCYTIDQCPVPFDQTLGACSP